MPPAPCYFKNSMLSNPSWWQHEINVKSLELASIPATTADALPDPSPFIPYSFLGLSCRGTHRQRRASPLRECPKAHTCAVNQRWRMSPCRCVLGVPQGHNCRAAPPRPPCQHPFTQPVHQPWAVRLPCYHEHTTPTHAHNNTHLHGTSALELPP